MFELPDFHGESWGNSKRWVSQFEFTWLPMKAMYGDMDNAKCTFFGLKLKGKAHKWADNQSEEVTSNYTAFSEALKQRFPKQDTSATNADGLVHLRTFIQPWQHD